MLAPDPVWRGRAGSLDLLVVVGVIAAPVASVVITPVVLLEGVVVIFVVEARVGARVGTRVGARGLLGVGLSQVLADFFEFV